MEVVYNGEILYKDEKRESVSSARGDSNHDEIVYKMAANHVHLLYSFNGDIVIRVLDECDIAGCKIDKYYKYNFDIKKMEEIEYSTLKENGIYSIEIIYK
jgi:hypothetical protein